MITGSTVFSNGSPLRKEKPDGIVFKLNEIPLSQYKTNRNWVNDLLEVFKFNISNIRRVWVGSPTPLNSIEEFFSKLIEESTEDKAWVIYVPALLNTNLREAVIKLVTTSGITDCYKARLLLADELLCETIECINLTEQSFPELEELKHIEWHSLGYFNILREPSYIALNKYLKEQGFVELQSKVLTPLLPDINMYRKEYVAKYYNKTNALMCAITKKNHKDIWQNYERLLEALDASSVGEKIVNTILKSAKDDSEDLVMSLLTAMKMREQYNPLIVNTLDMLQEFKI